jgi:ectoine hydroxylase-related dioxygenase (phytanoyl-CoA dioxygenase family)
MQSLIQEGEAWSKSFLENLNDEQRQWYLDSESNDSTSESSLRLRKLDLPHLERKVFLDLLQSEAAMEILDSLLGTGLVCLFSQLFFKPPEGGGPKPTHQDNFYFAPVDKEKIVTFWVAIDTATLENGCLYYWKGSHKKGVLPHWAPEDQPFNLQIAEKDYPADCERLPAPVKQGGVNLHHGFTLHQSSSNLSPNSRRAVAFHVMQKENQLDNPPLEYDPKNFLELQRQRVSI